MRTGTGRYLRVLDGKTAEHGTVSTIADVTDDVQREEELRTARGAADAASAAKSEFLSSMSHELRTPLNAVLGFAQLLEGDRKRPLDDRQLDRVRHVLRGGEHLLRLIDDVLDLSGIEAGRTMLSFEPRLGVLGRDPRAPAPDRGDQRFVGGAAAFPARERQRHVQGDLCRG